MNVIRGIAGLGIVAAIGWVVVVLAFPPAAPSITEPTRPDVPIVPASSTARCSGGNCHGSSIPEAEKPEDKWRWASTAWRLRDKHTQAYQVLNNKVSEGITKALKATMPAHQNPRCLACHADPSLAHLEQTPAVLDLQREGVNCEACHGRAEKWLAPHVAWKKGADRKALYEDVQMTFLNDLNTRAKVCAGCHVGAPADDAKGIKEARDMNHDLIAAGHPRLNFELATYTRMMPPHWEEKDRRKWEPIAPNFELRNWAAGQLGVVHAGLELTLDRIAADEADKPNRPWPELSETNCYDCHHALKKYERPVNAAGGVHGMFGWYRGTELEWLVGDAVASAFTTAMKQPAPDAAVLKAVIPKLLRTLRVPPVNPKEMLAKLVPEENSGDKTNWDDLSRSYHLLVAIELSRRASDKSGTHDEATTKALDAVAALLKFRKNPAGEWVNSPWFLGGEIKEKGMIRPARVRAALTKAVQVIQAAMGP